MEARKELQDEFSKKHGVKLGFMYKKFKKYYKLKKLLLMYLGHSLLKLLLKL